MYSVGESTQKRAITKSMSVKSTSFGSSDGSQSSQSESLYTYNYNIWTTDFDSSDSSDPSSPPSSVIDFIPPSSSFSSSPSASQPVINLEGANKRQLPSSKAQADVITKCIEKNIKYRCMNKTLMCSFCKNNGEPEVIYRSHSLKDSVGRITCPLLRNYVCPICGESGQNAHTITYCKKFKKSKQSSILSEYKF